MTRRELPQLRGNCPTAAARRGSSRPLSHRSLLGPAAPPPGPRRPPAPPAAHVPRRLVAPDAVPPPPPPPIRAASGPAHPDQRGVRRAPQEAQGPQLPRRPPRREAQPRPAQPQPSLPRGKPQYHHHHIIVSWSSPFKQLRCPPPPLLPEPPPIPGRLGAAAHPGAGARRSRGAKWTTPPARSARPGPARPAPPPPSRPHPQSRLARPCSRRRRRRRV